MRLLALALLLCCSGVQAAHLPAPWLDRVRYRTYRGVVNLRVDCSYMSGTAPIHTHKTIKLRIRRR